MPRLGERPITAALRFAPMAACGLLRFRVEPAGGGMASAATELYGPIRSPVVADITGALRSWTVSMISRLSIPRRYTDVTPRSEGPSCRYMTVIGIPSRAISIAWARRS
jgi:hypothetical protein